MLRRLLFTSFAICVATSTLPAAENEDLPDGKGKEIFVRMCSNCHALKRVTKVRFHRNFWESVVDDMVSRGAEGTEEEAGEVVGYLTRNLAKPKAILFHLQPAALMSECEMPQSAFRCGIKRRSCGFSASPSINLGNGESGQDVNKNGVLCLF